MVLDDDVLLVGLDAGYNLAEAIGTTDAGHVLQTDFVGTSLDELLGEVDIVFNGMNRRESDAKGGLCNHACLLGISDRWNDVAWVVKAAEDTGDVGALLLLHDVEELAEVLGAWEHAEGIECTVEHMGLDASLVEGLGPLTNRTVRILTIEKVNLLEAAAIGFYTVPAAHLDDLWGYLNELVNSRLVLASALPHVTEDKRKLNFFCHNFL